MKTLIAAITLSFLAHPAMSQEALASVVVMRAAKIACNIEPPYDEAIAIIQKAMDESKGYEANFIPAIEITADKFISRHIQNGTIGQFCAEMGRIYSEARR